jgi:hypothetical protein
MAPDADRRVTQTNGSPLPRRSEIRPEGLPPPKPVLLTIYYACTSISPSPQSVQEIKLTAKLDLRASGRSGTRPLEIPTTG